MARTTHYYYDRAPCKDGERSRPNFGARQGCGEGDGGVMHVRNCFKLRSFDFTFLGAQLHDYGLYVVSRLGAQALGIGFRGTLKQPLLYCLVIITPVCLDCQPMASPVLVNHLLRT